MGGQRVQPDRTSGGDPEDSHQEILRWGGQHPPDAPALPEGWEIGPPDVVGVGAPRCGSSWWFRQITNHPDVFYDGEVHSKEVHFFDGMRDVRELSEDDLTRYARHFPRVPGGGLTCEWTPRYMFDPWTIGQLRQAAPAARIVMILRDPVARYASAYALYERKARNFPPPDGTIEEMVASGMFFRPVQRVLDTYPREQVLILQYERCRLEYEHELDRTYEFLGLATGYRPAKGAWKARSPATQSSFHETSRGSVLAELYAADAAQLAELAPEIDLTLWPSVRVRV
jgi:hypothetical protein